jgi:hypothetical protein
VTDSPGRGGRQRPSHIRRVTSYLVEGVEVYVVDTALKHGVDEADILHALAHYGATFDVGEGLTMVIGPSRTGAPLEVGVGEWYGDLAALHAMPARKTFVEGWD